jgi:hypothetical protein
MYPTIIDMNGCASNQPVEPCGFNFVCVGSGARNHHLPLVLGCFNVRSLFLH